MNVHYTTRFKKDFKRITRQNKEPQKLRDVIEKLLSGKSLEAKYRDQDLFVSLLNFMENILCFELCR